MGRHLFVYLITNPHTHVSGLYYLPRPMMQHETGLSQRALDTLCDTLSRLGLARFDRANELIWVVNMFRYQGKGLKNTLSAARHLSEDVHNSNLVSIFLERYPEVAPHMKNTLSIRYPALAAVGTPEQEQEQEQEQEMGSRRKKTAAPDHLPITEEMKAWAAENGITANLAEEAANMCDHFRGKGELRADWTATWRAWMRKERKFHGSGRNGAHIRSPASQKFSEEELDALELKTFGKIRKAGEK